MHTRTTCFSVTVIISGYNNMDVVMSVSRAIYECTGLERDRAVVWNADLYEIANLDRNTLRRGLRRGEFRNYHNSITHVGAIHLQPRLCCSLPCLLPYAELPERALPHQFKYLHNNSVCIGVPAVNGINVCRLIMEVVGRGILTLWEFLPEVVKTAIASVYDPDRPWVSEKFYRKEIFPRFRRYELNNFCLLHFELNRHMERMLTEMHAQFDKHNDELRAPYAPGSFYLPASFDPFHPEAVVTLAKHEIVHHQYMQQYQAAAAFILETERIAQTYLTGYNLDIRVHCMGRSIKILAPVLKQTLVNSMYVCVFWMKAYKANMYCGGRCAQSLQDKTLAVASKIASMKKTLMSDPSTFSLEEAWVDSWKAVGHYRATQGTTVWMWDYDCMRFRMVDEFATTEGNSSEDEDDEKSEEDEKEEPVDDSD